MFKEVYPQILKTICAPSRMCLRLNGLAVANQNVYMYLDVSIHAMNLFSMKQLSTIVAYKTANCLPKWLCTHRHFFVTVNCTLL